MEKKDIDFSKIPDAPGVYFFLGQLRSGVGRKGETLKTLPKGNVRAREILYIGKATSLRDRLKSYFVKDLMEVRSPLVAKVVADASKITWEETDSVLDALILEAKRIKEYKPKGNTDEKDDKSFAYVVVTKERFPRILVARERELSAKFPSKIVAHLFGPFPSGGMLKAALKIIRRIFPFFDTNFALDDNMSEANAKTLRFNQVIGLYPPELDEASYKKTVRNIVLLFEAKKKTLLKTLEREMKNAAREERFEDAQAAKRQLFALRHIQDVTLIQDDLRAPRTANFRIEAYDTAHLRGEEPRGVMAVVVDGEAVPGEYRTFSIRTAKAGDDYQALQEIIERRAKHREWAYPQLIVIDGGRSHLNRAKKTLAVVGMNTDVVSVVKDERHRPKEILGASAFAVTHESSILLANAEAHRFSIGRHRKALRKKFT